MENIRLETGPKGSGHFYLYEGDERLGDMEINISGSILTVYHTEVA